MDGHLYSVTADSGYCIACHMELENALILIEGLALRYYNEPCLTYRIMREQTDCEDVSITESEVEE